MEHLAGMYLGGGCGGLTCQTTSRSGDQRRGTSCWTRSIIECRHLTLPLVSSTSTRAFIAIAGFLSHPKQGEGELSCPWPLRHCPRPLRRPSLLVRCPSPCRLAPTSSPKTVGTAIGSGSVEPVGLQKEVPVPLQLESRASVPASRQKTVGRCGGVREKHGQVYLG
jgi:hypothetical protein